MNEFPTMKGNARMARGASYFEVPLFSHVFDNLWQGCSPSEFPDTVTKKIGVHDYSFVTSDPPSCKWLMDGDEPRFDRILNLYPWGEYEVPLGTSMLSVEAYDSEDVFDELDELSDLVFDWLESGYRVLVHCQAGLNRSSLVIGYMLMKHYGYSADDAIQKIRDSRSPMCLCNDAFRQYLKSVSFDE